jgi:ATP-dependent Lon protease
MTGEVTLQGQVLPIGGLKHKALAAHRTGLKKVIIPRLNEVDLDDIPGKVRDELEFILVDDVMEVLNNVLMPEEKDKQGVTEETCEDEIKSPELIPEGTL